MLVIGADALSSYVDWTDRGHVSSLVMLLELSYHRQAKLILLLNLKKAPLGYYGFLVP